jgi:transporter family protein
MVSLRGEWRRPEPLSKHSVLCLVLSGIATGFSWLCYYRALQIGLASRVAPVDKLSVPLVMLIGGMLIVAGTLIVAMS